MIRRQKLGWCGLSLGLALSACRTTDPTAQLLGLDGCGGHGAAQPEYVDPHVRMDLTTTATGDAETLRKRAAGKTPLVVYLAVDTGEPFMKLSVDHEVRALRAACESQNAKVNWIAFVNSLLVATDGDQPKPVVARCDAGVYKVEPLAEKVARTLNAKREIYAADKKCNADESICLRVKQPVLAAKGQEFKGFPLAHADIILDMLEYTRTLYPADRFTYFVHLKSHGSEDFLTTGLGPDQVKEKAECQKEVFKNLHEQHPELFVPATVGAGETPSTLGEVGLGEVGLGEVGLGEVGLGEVGLGEVGLGEVGLGEVGLGEVGLGEVGLGEAGLGEGGLGKIGGLGLGVAGLGAANHYGSRHLSAVLALRWFTTRGTGNEDLGFVFFESCESRASRFLQHESMNCALPPADNPLTNAFNNIEGVYAYYSASHSLWYRNLDWDRLYKNWLTGPATAASFQSDLIKVSKLIPNYNFTSQDPLPPCP